jgi:acetolactate synthase-1/2/3 large subunit
MKRSVSDDVVEVLISNQIDHVFGITGAGNLSLFEALRKKPEITVVFTHHEQAAVMAANAFTRASGKISAVIVTTGAGASNAITGAVGANMDSVPLLIIAGTEPLRFIEAHKNLRGFGLQGFDTVKVMAPIVKFAKRISNPSEAINFVNQAISKALSGRQGVSWIEFPLDIQSLGSEGYQVDKFKTEIETTSNLYLQEIITSIESASKPLLLLGKGVRSGEAQKEAIILIEKLGIPFMLSWAGSDLISHDHPLYVGKAGLYGERSSNLLLQSCDYLLTVGTRLAIPQIGYLQQEFAPNAILDIVDIDFDELNKLNYRARHLVKSDSKIFLEGINKLIETPLGSKISDWYSHINLVKEKFSIISKEQVMAPGIHSNHFMFELSKHLREREVIVNDAGTSFISTHYALRLNGKQRLISSTGLGEMGFGLPAAIGAAFAIPDRRIVCINSDGGLMMNLQEFQTAVHHNLKLKIFIFNNDGYLSIKNSQSNLFDSNFIGVDPSTGLSFPSYKKIANAFGIPYFEIQDMSNFTRIIGEFMSTNEMGICEIYIDPLQPFEPRVSTARSSDGDLVSPSLEDMVPLISLQDLEWAIQRTANEKSYKIRTNIEQ